MHESHRQAAEQHARAAHAHRTAAEHRVKGDIPTGNLHSERAFQFAGDAYNFAKDAHSESAQIESL